MCIRDSLRSVQKAFEYIGFDATITRDRQDLLNASHVVLPGVGAIRNAMQNLAHTGLDDVIRACVKQGKPLFGICLGMQLLLEQSYEYGKTQCLSLIPGEVVPFDFGDNPKRLKIPHMGWNTLEPQGACVYFVHSYHATNVPPEFVWSTTTYGYEFVCAIKRDNIRATQFHPEKSGQVGLSMLLDFAQSR